MKRVNAKLAALVMAVLIAAPCATFAAERPILNFIRTVISQRTEESEGYTFSLGIQPMIENVIVRLETVNERISNVKEQTKARIEAWRASREGAESGS